MLLAPITVKLFNPEDIEMARLFRNALQLRIKSRNAMANVIRLPSHKASTQVLPSRDYNTLFEPMVNAFAA